MGVGVDVGVAAGAGASAGVGAGVDVGVGVGVCICICIYKYSELFGIVSSQVFANPPYTHLTMAFLFHRVSYSTMSSYCIGLTC